MLTLKFTAHGIKQIKSRKIPEVFVDRTKEIQERLEQCGLLDHYGSVLNHKEWVRFEAWEDKNIYTNAFVTVTFKPGKPECGKDENTLYYALRVHKIED